MFKYYNSYIQVNIIKHIKSADISFIFARLTQCAYIPFPATIFQRPNLRDPLILGNPIP